MKAGLSSFVKILSAISAYISIDFLFQFFIQPGFYLFKYKEIPDPDEPAFVIFNIGFLFQDPDSLVQIKPYGLEAIRYLVLF